MAVTIAPPPPPADRAVDAVRPDDRGRRGTNTERRRVRPRPAAAEAEEEDDEAPAPVVPAGRLDVLA